MTQHKICLLNDSFPPMIDGVATAVVNYATHITDRHGKAYVVTPEVPGADDSAYPFEVLRYPGVDLRKWIGYMGGVPFSPEVAHRLGEEKIDLLHTHTPIVSAMFGRELREMLDVPLVLTWHTKFDIDIANLIHSKFLQEEAIQALITNVNCCDEVWTVSRGAGENLRSLGYEGDYIVMDNGVDLPRQRATEAEIQAAAAGYDLPEDLPVFLFVGRLMWYKGLHIILDALEGLKAEGTDFRMVFIGGGGDEKEVRAEAESKRLTDKVIFTGPIRDRQVLRAWYSRADLFLFPSTFDTNGLVVREAAASDLPTMMIQGSCAAEGVTDGRNGILIEENAASMKARLSELCKAPDQLKVIGRNAGDELYLSWHDAVDRAAARYEIVMDRYKQGLYPKPARLQDDVVRAYAKLMESMGQWQAAGLSFAEEVRSDLQAQRDEFLLETASRLDEIENFRAQQEAKAESRRAEMEARVADFKADKDARKERAKSQRRQRWEAFMAEHPEWVEAIRTGGKILSENLQEVGDELRDVWSIGKD